jgi:hypothetical protein
MEHTTAYDIRRVLASNLKTFAESASRLRSHPTKIASITGFQTHADRCVANITFAFQIHAIDADTCISLRDIIEAVTLDTRRLRRIATAKNYICGQDSAISAAAVDAEVNTNLLWRAIDLLKDEEQPSIVTLTA